MTKKRMKIIAAALCFCVLAGSLTGCGGKEADGTEVMGRITAVSDSEITLAIFERPEGEETRGEKPDGVSGGAIGERPNPASGEAIQGGERPKGTPPAGKPEGETGEGKEEKFGNNSSETRKITISSDTKVYKQQGEEETEAAVSDLELGSMVTVVMDGDEADRITIQTMNGQRGGRGQKGANPSQNG